MQTLSAALYGSGYSLEMLLNRSYYLRKRIKDFRSNKNEN